MAFRVRGEVRRQLQKQISGLYPQGIYHRLEEPGKHLMRGR